MTLETLTTQAPPRPRRRRRFDDVGPDSWKKAKRSKRGVSDDVYLAGCLVALARSGGAASPSAATPAAVDADKHTKSSKVNSYKCTVCGKAFSSYQALGGHKASHRSKPPTAAADYGKPAAASSDYIRGPHPTGGLHQCSVCGKSFSTGQALGGHMRKHYGGVVGRNGGAKGGWNSSDGGYGNGSSVVTSFSDGGVSDNDVTGARNLDLDLNLPPPELDLTLKL